jgi:hypothetical protein
MLRVSCSFSTSLIVGYAQANSWSLEELHLDVTIAEESDQPSFDDCSFGVEGLKLTGAVCRYPYTTFIGTFCLICFRFLVWFRLDKLFETT